MSPVPRPRLTSSDHTDVPQCSVGGGATSGLYARHPVDAVRSSHRGALVTHTATLGGRWLEKGTRSRILFNASMTTECTQA